ncbi:MAG TPA: HAD-IB family phosphatase [Actinomycetota bacterium]|jgi:2,3-diketo-5-methylthio-1-phosphopentane phosphatase
MPLTDLAAQAIVVDYDGTICPNDVSEELLQRFAPAEWWEIDLQFQRGEIGSRECLVRQADLLEGAREEMLRFVLEHFAVDASFPPFAAWAKEQGLPMSIASDGLGFYIEPMLKAAGVAPIPVLTNAFSISNGDRDLSFPRAHPFCEGCGTCKMRIVRGHRHAAGTVAFVGEGHSDRYGALYADLVFANKHLAEICESAGVPFVYWTTFDDVRDGLERMKELPGPANPAVCPGWLIPART